MRNLIFLSLFIGVFFLVGSSWAQENVLPDWNWHYQATFLPEYHGSFPAAYTGANSLSNNPELNASFTTTLFLGARLWQGGSFYLDPEAAAGSGFSQVTGIADFPNGEIYRVSDPGLKVIVARAYYQQILGLGGERETLDDDQNQLSDREDVSRLTFAAGKFSLADFFDNNRYAHDARTQFMNWGLMGNAAWDYAADVQGYTLGVYGEWNQKDLAFRAAEALVSSTANGPDYDWNIGQAHATNAELEWRYSDSGRLRLLGYVNAADMGNYQRALDLSPVSPSVISTRAYREKYGWGLNWEQTAGSDLGFFARLGWNNGADEAWEWTAVDQTASAGLVLKGKRWGRERDEIGLGAVVSGLSSAHEAYLAAGGLDFIIGDGALNYAAEELFEIYYLYKPMPSVGLTLDFQGIQNPAYNQDRGPVGVVSGRVHFEL